MKNAHKFREIKRLRLLLGLALLAFVLPHGAVAAEAGKFQFVAGDIKVISPSGAQRVPAKGEAFNAGDTIITGAGASAQIRMSDGGLVAVRPDTQMKLDEYVFNGREDGTERKLVSLIKGGFRAITGLIGNRNKQNYKILTPSATIGIRGTDHEAVVIPPGTPGGFQVGTYDRVYRGATIIETDKGKLIVNPNQVGFTPGKGVAPVLLPKLPEFFQARGPRPDAGKEAEQDSAESDGKGDSKAEGRSRSVRSLTDLKRDALTKDQDLKDPSTTLRSPLDAAVVRDPVTTSTLKDATTISPTTSTLRSSTLSEPTTTLKSDVLSTPITVPTTTLKSTDLLTAPVTSPTTTIKTPTTTTITTPLTTTKPLTTTVTPKTESVIAPTTTTIRSITTKP